MDRKVPVASSSIAALLLTVAWAASAQPPPRMARIESSQSRDGSFALSFSGINTSECRTLAAGLTLDGNTSPTAHEIGTGCAFGFTTTEPLAAGETCVSIPDLRGDIEPACFTVTGANVDLGALKPSIQDQLPGVDDYESAASCHVCRTDPSAGSACTRDLHERSVEIHLGGAPLELASMVAVAAVPTKEGVTSAPPVERDFALLDDALAWTQMLQDREDGERPCLDVYTRDFATSTVREVAIVCTEPKLPNTAPHTYTPPYAACELEADYRAHWCADNAADCGGTQASAFAGCADYPQQCLDAGAPVDGGTRPDASAAASTDATVSDAAYENRAKHGASCTVASGPAASWPWASCAALLVLPRMLRRRHNVYRPRRTRRRLRPRGVRTRARRAARCRAPARRHPAGCCTRWR